jgi:putative ABC transport system ATP-binding protein
MMFETRALSRSYPNEGQGVHALHDVSIRIAAGELVAVSGPNGCGKTTLLHVLGLVDPNYRGQVWFEARAVEGLGARARAELRLSRIGFVFQHFGLLSALSALDNVALPHWRLHGSRQRARERARDLLALMELEHRARHRPGRLSGGEMQRVALARALVNEPVAIIADEPTAQLDERASADLVRLFEQIHAQGTTIVVASHDPVVREHAQRCYTMQHGCVTEGE